MKTIHQSHLTYCTNIHPGENWEAVFKSLETYALAIKRDLAPTEQFGIGLRLSDTAAKELLEGNALQDFKQWLDKENCYVFTMNGFPFGDFHDVVIKDKVHYPDWTTPERFQYTKNLIDILSELLPTGLVGGISTSPLSYKFWHQDEAATHQAKLSCTRHYIQIAAYLQQIEQEKGTLIHIDIEPEPDGLLENTAEVLAFYQDYLLSVGATQLAAALNCSVEKAKEYVLRYLQICYDVCHFALAFEEPRDTINQLHAHGIQVGKIQISAALKCKRSATVSIEQQQQALKEFDEPTYLHQAVLRLQDGSLRKFPDLKEGMEGMNDPDFAELRTHFHVPVFLADYGYLSSTQDAIEAALSLWKENPYSTHLEVETYTWGVLPTALQADLQQSIVRELSWIKAQL